MPDDTVNRTTGTPSIRPCGPDDAAGFLAARNAPKVRALSTDPDHIIAWSEHMAWWAAGTTDRFVVTDGDRAEAYFWHRARSVDGRNYLIGGWFPAGDTPIFTAAIRLLDWQLAHCAERYPDHIWVATIHRSNRAVRALNRRYDFVEADDATRAAVPHLFPGTTEEFEILQRKARL
ncbi:hypothetical protein F1188_08515 [Roseospira marina]|uniref:GNAT family N-acetyltransferase n=1 Tax=Roseospira marina TaxID=140057 RepID=A0A5M6IE94_9PROT|nr:hypothetical protein [Roseospira marina]KAA5606045.1 hypothetical protein F1188_08515 [Roseospira marina]MBB4313094.1 hypothetical protein [Roseospira marina]MBB5086165.1 hypothetical protein [Roseospira marina]